MENLFLEDESSDKKYFTQIPNYIANHSTAIDQALYFQLKRFAGEKGTCFASQRTLLEKLGIGQKAFYKSIKYLIDHKWVSFVGYKSVITEGGTQKIKAYRINDIWKMNMEYYQGVCFQLPLNPKGVVESNLGGSQKEVQGVAESGTNKNKSKEEQEKKREIATSSPTPKEVSSRFFSEESNDEQESIIAALVENGMPEQVARREIEKFVSSWTEKNQTGTKQRWQQEKTFEIKRRLTTWFQRVNQFNGLDRQKNKVAFL